MEQPSWWDSAPRKTPVPLLPHGGPSPPSCLPTRPPLKHQSHTEWRRAEGLLVK